MKKKIMDVKAAMTTVKIMAFTIVSIITGVLCIFFLVEKLNDFSYLPQKYLGNTLEYHDAQLTQEGFSFLGKTKTEGISEHLKEDVYIYRKKASLGLYHYVILRKNRSQLKINYGIRLLSTPFNKLIFSYYENFVPKEEPPIVDREKIENNLSIEKK